MAGHTDKEKSSKSMKEKPMKEKAPSRKGGNPWINHVKAQAKKLKIGYNEALKDPRVKKSYKSKK
tara:strand:+ start:632 stop:826 length:195 start_codon:yes stop_codon:yes gene_type:complete